MKFTIVATPAVEIEAKFNIGDVITGRMDNRIIIEAITEIRIDVNTNKIHYRTNNYSWKEEEIELVK